jgi:amino-acid N-acetyltransferase
LQLRPAIRDDLPAIVGLLQTSELPTEDVPDIMSAFVLAYDGSTLAGTVALERFGSVGLLRSLAVVPGLRGRGVARRLCEDILNEASRLGVADLYLLTTDADGYFARLGFAIIDREQTPDAIRQTREFGDLCPSTAIVMHKRLT